MTSAFPSLGRTRSRRAFRPRILTLCYVIPDYPHPDDKLPCTADEAAYLKRVSQASAVEPHALPLRRVLRGPGDFDLLYFAGHDVAEQEDIVNTATRGPAWPSSAIARTP